MSFSLRLLNVSPKNGHNRNAKNNEKINFLKYKIFIKHGCSYFILGYLDLKKTPFTMNK